MYNQIPVFKGGYANNPDIDHPVIDTSHFLTVAKANHMYVNEIGDDSMSGTLDMRQNRIVNIADPTHSQDVANKRFVDSQNTATKAVLVNDFVTRRNTFTESQVFQKELDMSNNKITNLSNPTLPKDASNKDYVDKLLEAITSLTTRVSNLEQTAGQTNSKESEFRSYIDNHKWSGEAISTGTISADRLPYRQYGFILNIGTSESNRKTTTHSIKLPHLNLTYKKVNLQLTVNRETTLHNEEIFSNIKHFAVENFPPSYSFIMVVVDTTIYGGGTKWGLHLKANLLITVFEIEMMEIENNP